jgi:DNA-directed RNA polymerase specialized sigma24 family protein
MSHSKLDKRKAFEMRRAGASIMEIAEYFQCSRRTVNVHVSHVSCAVNHWSIAVTKRHRDGQTKIMMKGLSK